MQTLSCIFSMELFLQGTNFLFAHPFCDAVILNWLGKKDSAG